MSIFQSDDWQSQFLRNNDNNTISKTVSDEELSTENPNPMHDMDLDTTTGVQELKPKNFEELSTENLNPMHDMNLDTTTGVQEIKPKNIEKYEILEHINNNIQNIIHIIHSSNGRLHNDKERFLQTLYTAMFDSSTRKKNSIKQFSDILGIS